MIIKNNMAQSIQQVQQKTGSSTRIDQTKLGHKSFQNILQQQLGTEELKFSKHANQRLQSRNITLSDDQINRLNNGLQNARAKGVNESLMLVDNVALVVNVDNSTVITALERSETKDHVFTNIDGAVLL